ncbi:transposase [Streptomyces sp. V4I8]
MSKRPGCVWCGIDGGKGHHWAAVVDETGTTVWSKKIDNDESAILTALGEILDLADEVRWAVDISGTPSALLLALLAAHGQQAVYVPGRTVNRMAGAYRGEAKTDARDAYVIAETARHRRDLATIGVPVQLAADLTLLTSHRTDLVADRVRLINRLRDVLTGIFPALERDSGRRTGNLHRPKRYSRRLRRVFYLSAQTSIIREGPNRDFYLKKRGEGLKHVQAIIALARRRASVLWALLRDNRVFTFLPPATQTA